MGFAFSKLTALARGRAVPVEDAPVPALRRADAHPDAPARAPIFARKDFDGLDIFDRASQEEAAAPAEPTFLRDAPSAVEPDRQEAESLRDEPLSFVPPAERREEPLAPLPLRAPTQGLSIAELTERLERGLSQRTRATVPPVTCEGVLADMPVAQPVPVRDHVAQDADAALREALGTLRSMAGRR